MFHLNYQTLKEDKIMDISKTHWTFKAPPTYSISPASGEPGSSLLPTQVEPSRPQSSSSHPFNEEEQQVILSCGIRGNLLALVPILNKGRSSPITLNQVETFFYSAEALSILTDDTKTVSDSSILSEEDKDYIAYQINYIGRNFDQIALDLNRDRPKPITTNEIEKYCDSTEGAARIIQIKATLSAPFTTSSSSSLGFHDDPRMVAGHDSNQSYFIKRRISSLDRLRMGPSSLSTSSSARSPLTSTTGSSLRTGSSLKKDFEYLTSYMQRRNED